MPTGNEIRNALLQELYRQPDYSLSSQQATDEIDVGYFTISSKDRNERFVNSKSKFKNRVQVVRNQLVAEGLLLPTEISGRDVWKLSEIGILEARRIYLLNNDDDPHEHPLFKQINQDLFDLNEEEGGFEGGIKSRLSNYYERKPLLRAKAIMFHGKVCKACNFDFEKVYGELGVNFIEVHHLVPLSSYKEFKFVNPERDMTVLCSNCHRMIHRKPHGNLLSLDDLKQLLIIQKHTQ